MTSSIRAAAIVFIGIVAVLSAFNVLLISRRFESIIFSQIVTSQTQTTDREREIVSAAVRNYLFRNEELSAEVFTQRERMHMADVKNIISAEIVIWLVAMIVAAALFVLLHRRGVSRAAVLQHAALAWAIVSVIALLVVFFLFDQLFETFHVIAFDNALWLFDPPTHILIRVYPPDFFHLFSQYLVMATAGMFILFALAASIVLHRNAWTRKEL